MHVGNRRFVIGIDLGTTNSAVAYFDSEKPNGAIQLFRIPQLDQHGHKASLPMLPSCLYLLPEKEELIVGAWALNHGSKLPTHLIHSAKSWLSNAAAARKEKILPFSADEKQKKLSPVEATTHYLAHIRKMWNREMAKSNTSLEIEEQDVILTVPASFDEVARRLTVEAAKKAGYQRFTLLEEPQAAFYTYLMDHGTDLFTPNESILVCDVGGGTTDFSLIDVVQDKEGIGLRRMAVGKHLLLGGDNMDATLCHLLQKRYHLELDMSQHLSLLHQVRSAKEELLNHAEKNTCPIFISGKGSQVIGGSAAFELSREEVEEVLVEGFFEVLPFEQAAQIKKMSAIRQMGLPYESDPSITKHLAHFLKNCKKASKPNYLLFNGGAMKPSQFQTRIIDALNMWFGPHESLHVLPSASLDLAVARGAAYYGKMRRGEGIRIGGGSPRAYYIHIAVEGKEEKQALTLLARGSEEGTRISSSHLFSLIPNTPVSFQVSHSHTRLEDQPGEIIPIDEEQLMPLPLLQTICRYGKQENTAPLTVNLEAHLTEIGTLELWLHSQISDHKWKLEFQLRGETQEESAFDKRLSDETFDTHDLEPAKRELRVAFAVGSQAKLKGLMSCLEHVLGMPRQQWAPSLLRTLYATLQEQADKRLLSANYEQRFWNLSGFLLRPGIGYPLDDHRITQLWKLILADSKRVKSDEVQLQQWICFRRIAAGLSKGQQQQLFNSLFPLVYDKKKQKFLKNNKNVYLYLEKLRTLAALELIETSQKILLGSALLKRILKGEADAGEYWALGRLGARHLFHGTQANVIPAHVCEKWVEALLSSSTASHPQLAFTMTLLARKTDVHALNLNTNLIEKVRQSFATEDKELEALLLKERELSSLEQNQFFGDSLPTGLTLVS